MSNVISFIKNMRHGLKQVSEHVIKCNSLLLAESEEKNRVLMIENAQLRRLQETLDSGICPNCSVCQSPQTAHAEIVSKKCYDERHANMIPWFPFYILSLIN